MRLSTRDGNIIAQSALFADESIPEIAERCEEKIHTVRYVLSELVRRGLLRKRWVIDLMSAGWSRYEVFFSASTGSKKVRQHMVDLIKSSERTTYFAEVGGEFDYELIVLAKSAQQVKDLLADWARQCGEVSFSKMVALHQRVHYFPRKYLASSKMKPYALTVQNEGDTFNLTELDHKILRGLSENPDISQRELAVQCGCAPLTVQSHLEKLRVGRVIRGAMYSLSANVLGAQNYILLVYAKGFSKMCGDKLYQFCIAHPHCTNMKECFGSWDFEVGVEVVDYAQLREIRDQLFEKFASEIQGVTVLSRFTNHKYDFYPLRGERQKK